MIKVALCFIISGSQILHKEKIWQEWIETNKDIINIYFYYTPKMQMANSPHKNTITVSFTLPKWLNDKVEDKASAELTNKSDIIRRALVAHVGGLGLVPAEGKSSRGRGSKVAEDDAGYEFKKKTK